jgi:hypothetical protein
MNRCGLPCGVFQKPVRAHDWALLLLCQLSSEKFCKAEHQCLHRSTAEQGQELLVLAGAGDGHFISTQTGQKGLRRGEQGI